MLFRTSALGAGSGVPVATMGRAVGDNNKAAPEAVKVAVIRGAGAVSVWTGVFMTAGGWVAAG